MFISIIQTKNYFSNYFKYPNIHFFFILQTTTEEVYKSIQKLQLNESSSPNDMPKILKLTKGTILKIMSASINKTFLNGIPPNFFAKL